MPTTTTAITAQTAADVSLSYSFQVGRPTRQKIVDLQAALAEQPDAMGEAELEEKYNEHFFAPGVYGRLMHIPAGMCVVGKIHKHAHLNVITKGVIKVVTEFGEELYTGPKIFVSEPGTKRAVVALEDTDWLTIHTNRNEHRDLRALEDEIIAPSFEAFDRLRIEQGDIV